MGTVMVSVNGESRRVAAGSTVADLLSALRVDRQAAAVMLNGGVVQRIRHHETLLKENDRVDILTFAAGG